VQNVVVDKTRQTIGQQVAGYAEVIV